MKRIQLTKRKTALVDDDDYTYLNRWKWRAVKDKKRFTAVRTINGKITSMHRFLLVNQVSASEVVLHKDKNNLNNQRYNLFVPSQDVIKNGVSEYIGVNGVGHNWKASIVAKSGRKYHLGVFNTEKEAAIAYDNKARTLFKECAVLNFPKENREAVEKSKQSSLRHRQTKTVSKSGFRGVTKSKLCNSYSAFITKNYVHIYLGSYSTAEQAAREYDKKASEFYGKKAVLNFPNIS